jgi:hypothetical protein
MDVQMNELTGHEPLAYHSSRASAVAAVQPPETHFSGHRTEQFLKRMRIPG